MDIKVVQKKKSNKGLLIALLVILIIGIAIGGFALYKYYNHNVPSIVGMETQQAKDSLEDAGLVYVVQDRAYSDSVEKGCIISQSIAAGDSIKSGTKVQVVISKGEQPKPKAKVKKIIVKDNDNSSASSSSSSSSSAVTDIVYYAVRSDGVNVRSEPKHKSSLVVAIPDNSTPLTYMDDTSEGYGSDGKIHTWYKVQTPDGDIGWVRSDLVK